MTIFLVKLKDHETDWARVEAETDLEAAEKFGEDADMAEPWGDTEGDSIEVLIKESEAGPVKTFRVVLEYDPVYFADQIDPVKEREPESDIPY